MPPTGCSPILNTVYGMGPSLEVSLVHPNSAGMMLVPLNALIQAHSAKDGLGSVLAGKNWIQNMAMIGLLLLTVLLAKSNVNSVYILYLNALIAVVGFTVVLRRLKAIL